MPKGAIVGVIGGNGAGKSTLFRMLMGKETPDSGTIEVGETVQLACVDQSREDLDGSKTVFQQISDGSDQIRIGNYEIPSRTYVGRFNFKGGDQQKFVKDLSGGERGRLHLALTLKEGVTSCCSTNRPTTSTLKPCVPWKKLCWTSRAPPL